jgi:hypothetical protein
MAEQVQRGVRVSASEMAEAARPMMDPSLSRSRTRLVATPAARAASGLVKAEKPAQASSARPELSDDERAAREAVRKIAAIVCWRFPQAFRIPRVPLAIGIAEQLAAALGEDVEPQALGRFIGWWVKRWDYLVAVTEGIARHNLDGSLAGFPTVEHQRAAAIRVYGERAPRVIARIEARQEEGECPM